MATNRNASIDAMRFIFILFLCPVHCPAVSPFPNGYIAVEFFFVLAGFFIYQSYKKHSDIGTIDFTLKKLKRFLWPLVISFVLLVLLDRKGYIYPHELSPDGILSQYFIRIPEFMFCQGLQLIDVGHYINVTLWFISILLIGGAILFSLLKSFGHKTISVILPLAVLLGITYLRSFGNCGLIWRPQLPGSPFDCNLIRGIIEMGIGIILAYVYEIKKESFDRYNTLVNVLGLIGLAGMFLIVCAKRNYDTLSLFLIPMIIVACMQPETIYSKLFKNKVWSWLGGLSMYIYFIHSFVSAVYYIFVSRISVMNDLPLSVSLIGYLVVCTFAGVVLKIVCEKLYCKTFK